jgi:hypothetical protein
MVTELRSKSAADFGGDISKGLSLSLTHAGVILLSKAAKVEASIRHLVGRPARRAPAASGISALFRVVNRYVGNLAPMPGVFPDYKAPIVRAGAEGREHADSHESDHSATATTSLDAEDA